MTFFNQMEAQNKYPTLLLDAVRENRKLILVPTEPTVYQGQERWAWLEIDPDTCQAISVFDTGLHSAMAEFKLAMMPSDEDTIKWMKGIWVGTNISVRTMCSSSLKYDDYAAILNDLKAAATMAANAVSDFFDMSDSLKEIETGGEIELGGGAAKIDFKIGMSGIKGSLSQNMFSLSAGMKLAIDTYFNRIAAQ